MATSSASAGPLLELTFEPSLAKVEAHIKVLALELKDFKEPLQKCIKDVIIPSIQANFAAGGRPAWAPYAQETLDFHKMLGESLSDSLLVKTGALKSAMGSESIWTISSTEAYIAGLPSNVWYGYLHQQGYPGGSGNGPIPARPFAMLQEQDLADIDKVFDKWLHEAIIKAWPGD